MKAELGTLQANTAGARTYREPLTDAVPRSSAETAIRDIPAAGSAELADLQAREAASEHYQLALRFVVLNLAAFALLGAAWGQGWIERIVAADVTSVTLGIFVIFLGGLAACAREVWRVSKELDAVHAAEPEPTSWTARYLSGIVGRDAGGRTIIANAMRSRFASRIAIVRYVANILVLLGLVGTVIGFVIALSAVEPEATGNVDAIAPMVARLLQGMSVALYTTLVGTVLHLWLGANYHILAVGVSRFVTQLISRGERHA